MVLWQIEIQATQDRLLLIIQINVSIKNDIINNQSWDVEIPKNVYKHSIRFFLDLRHASANKKDLWVIFATRLLPAFAFLEFLYV